MRPMRLSGRVAVEKGAVAQQLSVRVLAQFRKSRERKLHRLVSDLRTLVEIDGRKLEPKDLFRAAPVVEPDEPELRVRLGQKDSRFV